MLERDLPAVPTAGLANMTIASGGAAQKAPIPGVRPETLNGGDDGHKHHGLHLHSHSGDKGGGKLTKDKEKKKKGFFGF